MTVELDDAKAAAPQLEAARRGLTLKAWLHEMASADAGIGDKTLASPPACGEDAKPVRPFLRMVRDVMKDSPADVFDKLPRDGAAEHDHYLYGTPKKNF